MLLFFGAGILSFLVSGVLCGYTVVLDPGVRCCFFENLKSGDRLGINYEVDPDMGSSRKVDLVIYGPLGEDLLNIKGEGFGTYHVRARSEGKHHYCFTSRKSVRLGFNLLGTAENQIQTRDPLDDAMKQLVMGLRAIRDEQEYLVLRERMHHRVAASTNSRVLWWYILQYVLLIAVCWWQVYYLRRFFEARRRPQ